jgi:hypothetical protein
VNVCRGDAALFCEGSAAESSTLNSARLHATRRAMLMTNLSQKQGEVHVSSNDVYGLSGGRGRAPAMHFVDGSTPRPLHAFSTLPDVSVPLKRQAGHPRCVDEHEVIRIPPL